MIVFGKRQFEELAEAVLLGMPMEEAEKRLEEQRGVKAKGEEYFWLRLKDDSENAKTTIQITKRTKNQLVEMQSYPNEPYEVIIKRIIELSSKVPHLEAENSKLKNDLEWYIGRATEFGNLLDEKEKRIKELEQIIIEDREMRG